MGVRKHNALKTSKLKNICKRIKSTSTWWVRKWDRFDLRNESSGGVLNLQKSFFTFSYEIKPFEMLTKKTSDDNLQISFVGFVATPTQIKTYYTQLIEYSISL